MKEQNFENEAALQETLYEAPEIIPLEKLGKNWTKPKLFIGTGLDTAQDERKYSR